MPSGAKKRKAAKKKLQKAVHNNGAHSQGNEDTKQHDDRESDDGDAEREPSDEGAGNNYEQDAKEISLRVENIAELAKEVKPGQEFNDVNVEADDTSRELQNGTASEEHKSSTSSSSEDDEVTVEKEKPMAPEFGEMKQQSQSSLLEDSLSNEIHKVVDYVPEATPGGNPLNSKVAHESVDTSIPIEESVKEVVSSPQELNLATVSKIVHIEGSTVSDLVESAWQQNVDEVSLSSDEQHNISSALTNLLQEKTESKLNPVVDNCYEKSSETVDTTARGDEDLLPQSSCVTTVDRNGGNDGVKERHNHSEEKPLVSSVSLAVQRTSWMSCCGLFELLSRGSNR